MSSNLHKPLMMFKDNFFGGFLFIRIYIPSHMFSGDRCNTYGEQHIDGSHDLQGCLAELIYLLIDCG